nr:WecB/TagA/CpsF family glycosyltransferase [Duganella sp. 1224]
MKNKHEALTSVVTDFQRDVHCLLGLPFDALDLRQAQQAVLDAIGADRRCFFSTPNLNFLIGCLDDAAFRNSVIRSDLSLADGMPIIWIARLLGVPLRERVAGSTLFELLRQQQAQPLRVYFFGGPDGVARQAADALNAAPGAMRCVGSCSPGFGSTEALSSDAMIDDINASGADLLVVALGAKRGQAWIEYNLPRLRAPAVSHLGAVLNFVAGTITRAPSRVGNLGLEWLWRIKEEPALWRRYRDDGTRMLRLLLTRVLPALWHGWRQRRRGVRQAPRADLASVAGHYRLTLAGDWHAGALAPLRALLDQLNHQPGPLSVDMAAVSSVDSATLGLLLLLYGHQQRCRQPFALGPCAPAVTRALRLACVDFLAAPGVPSAPF